MRTRSPLAAAATLTLLILLTGCGEDATDSAEEPTSPAATSEEATEEPPEEPPEEPKSSAPEKEAEEVVITIKDFAYSDPGPVAPGTEITVENEDDAAHTVTADGDGGFDVTIAPGETGTFTAPSKAGEYAYLCTFHAEMTATLVVE